MLAINPEQFGGCSFEKLQKELSSQNEVKASFDLNFKANQRYIFLEYRDPASPASVEMIAYPNTGEGLSKALFKGMRVLEEQKQVDGFQVENEDAETYAYESFEVLDLASALSAYLEAVQLEPDNQWYINIIGPDDIEEPSYVFGVAEFDLDNAPI